MMISYVLIAHLLSPIAHKGGSGGSQQPSRSEGQPPAVLLASYKDNRRKEGIHTRRIAVNLEGYKNPAKRIQQQRSKSLCLRLCRRYRVLHGADDSQIAVRELQSYPDAGCPAQREMAGDPHSLRPFPSREAVQRHDHHGHPEAEAARRATRS